MDEGFIEELVAMPAARLDERMRAAEMDRRDAEARLAMIAAVVEQRQQFLSDGHRSMNAYLKAHLNCSGSEANRIRRRGKLLNEHECARDAIGAGHLSMSNVDLLAKAAVHPRAGERMRGFVPQLVEHGEHFPVNDYRVLVDRVISNADPDGRQPSDDHDANATVVAGPDGVHINVIGGTALQAAEMKAVFDLAVEAEFAADVEARRVEHGDNADQWPLPRTAAQRRFAAQYAIHLASVTVPADGQRPEPIVDIMFSAGRAERSLREHGLVDDTDLFNSEGTETDADARADGTDDDHLDVVEATRNADDDDGVEGRLVVEDPDDLFARRCETSTGVTLDDHAGLRAMIRGHVRRVVIDAAGVVIDVGRKRRLFTGAARHAAQLVALSCSHPGCSIPAEFCDVDHLERHADGGPTDQHNAGPGCGSHNRYKERAQLRSRRARNGRIYLIRPDNSVILPAGERPPRWADEHTSSIADADSESGPRSESSMQGPADRPASRPPPTSPVFETISWSDYVANGRRPRCPDTWVVTHLDATHLPPFGSSTS